MYSRPHVFNTPALSRHKRFFKFNGQASQPTSYTAILWLAAALPAHGLLALRFAAEEPLELAEELACWIGLHVLGLADPAARARN